MTASAKPCVQRKISVFYADDGLVGSRDADWLQAAMAVLTELFERVGGAGDQQHGQNQGYDLHSRLLSGQS